MGADIRDRAHVGAPSVDAASRLGSDHGGLRIGVCGAFNSATMSSCIFSLPPRHWPTRLPRSLCLDVRCMGRQIADEASNLADTTQQAGDDRGRGR